LNRRRNNPDHFNDHHFHGIKNLEEAKKRTSQNSLKWGRGGALIFRSEKAQKAKEGETPSHLVGASASERPKMTQGVNRQGFAYGEQ
jgi:hypothetical protein